MKRSASDRALYRVLVWIDAGYTAAEMLALWEAIKARRQAQGVKR
jgi:hypothetical protein